MRNGLGRFRAPGPFSHSTTERGSLTAIPRKRQDLPLSLLNYGPGSTRICRKGPDLLLTGSLRHQGRTPLHPRLQRFLNGVAEKIPPPTRRDPDSSGRSGSIRGPAVEKRIDPALSA